MSRTCLADCPKAAAAILLLITITMVQCVSVSPVSSLPSKSPRRHVYSDIKTHQAGGNLGDAIKLSCPHSTTIHIVTAFMVAPVLASMESSEEPSVPSTYATRPMEGKLAESGNPGALDGPGNWPVDAGQGPCSERHDISGIVQSLCRSKSQCTIHPSNSKVLTEINVCHHYDYGHVSTIDEMKKDKASIDSGLGIDGRLIDVAYKCRPKNSSRIVCEGTKLDLVCQDGHVILIREALFGPADLEFHNARGKKRARAKCSPMTDNVPKLPLCQFVPVHRITRRCHGRPTCTVDSTRTFLELNETQAICPDSAVGQRGPIKHHVLHVEYTCAPNSIYQDKKDEVLPTLGDTGVELTQRTTYRTARPKKPDFDKIEPLDRRQVAPAATDEPVVAEKREPPVGRRSQPTLATADISPLGPLVKDTPAPPPDTVVSSSTSESPVNCTVAIVKSDESIGFAADWLSAYVFMTRNLERLTLYLLVSILGAFVAVFAVLSCKLYCSKRRLLRRVSDDAPLCPPLMLQDSPDQSNLVEPLVSTIHPLHHHRHRAHSRRRSATIDRNSNRVASDTTGQTDLYSPNISNGSDYPANGHSHRVEVVSHQSNPVTPEHYSVAGTIRYATISNFRSPQSSGDSATPSPGTGNAGHRQMTPSRSTNASLAYNSPTEVDLH
ncbi:hypothetical protein HDE_01772 [Halotydeus destructor]|nr:hypothetical protein HDE_01772 [Halotydeus destructor]